MKKIPLLLLIFVIVLSTFGLTSCSKDSKEEGAISFKSSQEMLNSVQGVWMYERKDFIVFKDEEMYVFGTQDFEYVLGEIYLEKISKNEDFKAIEYQSITNNLEEKIFESPYVVPECNIDYKKGEILFNRSYLYKRDIDFNIKIVITKEGIKYGNENASFSSEYQYKLFKKVEDSPSLNSKTFEDLFDSTKDEHIIKPNPFFPKTGAEYAEILKENYPGLKDWTLYNDGDGTQSTVYVKHGNAAYGSLTYNDSLCAFLWGSNNKNFVVYKPDDKHLIIQGNSSFGEELYKYADWLLEKYPYKLSGSELFDMFEKEAKVSGGAKSFSKTVDNVEYKIDQSVSAGSGVIQIKCK